jgi:hypothetical protein
MVDKTPIITRIVKRSQTQTDKWPVLLLIDVETESGPLALQLTANAAHELSAHLNPLPPRIGPGSGVERL